LSEEDHMPEIVRTKTTRYAIEWVKLEFLPFDEKFRAVRQRHRSTTPSRCYICHRPFADGEMMALAGCRRGNKLICRACGETLLAEFRAEVRAKDEQERMMAE